MANSVHDFQEIQKLLYGMAGGYGRTYIRPGVLELTYASNGQDMHFYLFY
jgi:hypothetical protein